MAIVEKFVHPPNVRKWFENRRVASTAPRGPARALPVQGSPPHPPPPKRFRKKLSPPWHRFNACPSSGRGVRRRRRPPHSRSSTGHGLARAHLGLSCISGSAFPPNLSGGKKKYPSPSQQGGRAELTERPRLEMGPEYRERTATTVAEGLAVARRGGGGWQREGGHRSGRKSLRKRTTIYSSQQGNDS